MSHLFNRSKQVKPMGSMYYHQQSLDMWTGSGANHANNWNIYPDNERIFLDDQYLSLSDVDAQEGLTRKQKEKLIGIDLELPSCIFQKLFEEDEKNEERLDKTILAGFFDEFIKFENYDRFINLVSISKSYDEIINSHVEKQKIYDCNSEHDSEHDSEYGIGYELSNQYDRMTVSADEKMMVLLPEVKNYYDDEYDMMSNYDMMNEMNVNCIVKGMSRNFMDILIDTYPDDEKIVKQFMLDFPRNTVSVNNQQVDSVDKFVEMLTPFNRNHVMFNEDGNRKRVLGIIPFIMSFVCQSSFYPSYIHLFNKLQKMKDTNSWNNGLNNIHLTDTKERNTIEINVTEDKIQCALIACFQLIDVGLEENVLYSIKAETLFDSDMDNYLIVYKTYK